MVYIKTKIGEHDYHKPACSEYCKMGGEFCPFLNESSDANKVESLPNIVRWTDIADNAKNTVLGKGKGEGEDIGYTATFSEKTVDAKPTGDSLSDSNIRAEYDESEYTCWGDGSGFEYDQMSRNVMGPGGTMESIYDISRYGIEHKPLKFSEWNAWIDKFQYDYRFGRVSDTNAECILFPNVDNPWMFTEYVFKGIGGESDKCKWKIPEEYVVEPLLYNPFTLNPINSDIEISNPSTEYNGKYKEDCDGLQKVEDKYKLKKYRQIINWKELTTWSLKEAGNNTTAWHTLNGTDDSDGSSSSSESDDMDGDESLSVLDAGAKLYCARLPVQSIKWGEHGNIPPHTLDMTAPKSWMDPASMVTKMKAVYDAVVGSTIDSPYDGKIGWEGEQNREAYVYVGMTLEKHEKTSTYNGKSVTYAEYYSYSGGAKTSISMPQDMALGKSLKPSTKIMPDSNYGEYCHGGCGNLIGLNGRLQCKLIMNGDLSKCKYFNSTNCLHKGSYGDENDKCGSYVATREHPKIAAYQDKRLAVDQTSLNLSNAFASGMLLGVVGGVGGALAGAAMTAGMISAQCDKIAQYYSNLGKRGDVEISYVVRYEPVLASEMKAQLNKKKYNEFGKNVQIVPGTGKYAIDSKENANPFSGGDTNVYDDINTLSFHRFFASVMHCANHKYCNDVVGQVHTQGFSFAERSKGEDDCRYYKEYVNGSPGCPYNCAPKRAIEFASCANSISTRITQLMELYNHYAMYYVWDLEPGELSDETTSMYERVTTGNYTWCKFGTFAVSQTSDTLALVAVEIDSNGQSVSKGVDYSPDWSGAALLKNLPKNNGSESSLSLPSGYLLLGEFRTTKKMKTITIRERSSSSSSDDDDDSSSSDDGYRTVTCRLYHASDAFYWFQPLDNKGNKLKKDTTVIPNLRQNVDENGYWFCKAEFFTVPTTNCMIVDNEDKFIGGWHPEYKDYSKIGSEFMQDVVSDESREGQGKGDTVRTGDYTPIPQAVNKKGYWIDQSGEYILDERSIGADEPIAGENDREEAGGSGAVCISFKKSNTTLDGETGKRRQPKVLKAALFSNDPYGYAVNELLEKGKPKLQDPDTGSEYVASPMIKNRYLLPTMRHALHCPKCDYYIVWKYHDIAKCPWCGTTFTKITGDAGTDMTANDTWDKDASIIRKFFKIYSLGTADVWAPPGTSLKTDAYFWRHQAQITNATRKQIMHRLGDANTSVTEVTTDSNGKETGGVYQFNKMSATSEMTLGYPEGLGKFIRIPEGAETDTKTEERYGKSYIDWKSDQRARVDGMWNPVMPRHMIPEWYGKSDENEEDEGVIAPYTSKSNDALKMVSYEQMRVLRNAIEPLYAYTTKDSYSGDYPTHRASYDQREVQNQPIIWQGRKSTISPQVLACVDKGGDSYQTYFSGDLVYGNVREYFPSGYTWWMANNTLGGRYTENKGGWYHMDDGGSKGKGHMCGGSGGEYNTGTRTVAKCAMSIYGLVPLDKEIVAAYLLIRPGSANPSKNPVGRSWTGGPVMYCHYHAKTVKHKYNYKKEEEGDDYEGDDGFIQHLHGTAGYPNDQYFDDDGNFVDPHPGIYYASDDIRYQDESAYRLWGEQSNSIGDDRGLYYEDRVKDIMTGIPCLYDTEFHRNVGTAKVSVLAYDGDESIGMGYDEQSFGSIAGFTIYNLSNTAWKRKEKFQYIVVDDDGMVVSKYPESKVWKTDSTEQIEKTIRRHMATIEVKASDGTIENSKSYVFRQADSDLYMNQMPRQSQAITGYFDMSWANTKGYVYDEYSVQKSTAGTNWDAPVIFQGDEPAAVNSDYNISTNYSGGGTSGQIGEVTRCIPITSIIQEMWKHRIQRSFSANAGCTLAEIKSWKFYKTLVKGTLDALDDDVSSQNSRIEDNGYILLTDTTTYPKLDGDASSIPTIDPDGDKYELAEKEAELLLNLSTVMEITGDNCNYKVKIDDSEIPGSLEVGNYSGVTDALLDQIKSMFAGCKVEKASSYSILVTNKKKIEVCDCDNDCYGLLGISVGTKHPVQNRVYEVTGNSAGYSPTTLMGDTSNGLWAFDTYNNTFQSFTVDLLRAPLCKSQKDWRYEEGSADYSSVKCPSEGCKAHSMGCSVAANMSNKHFNSSSPYCPICGASLANQPGATKVPGDGIMTYEYDAPFSPNPFIAKIVIAPHQTYKTSYRVFTKPDGFSSWRSVANVVYRSGVVDEGYSLLFCIDKSASVDTSTGKLTISITDGSLRARHIKVECDADMRKVFHQYQIEDQSDGNPYQVIAKGSFSNLGLFSFEGITAMISDTNENPFTSSSSSEEDNEDEDDSSSSSDSSIGNPFEIVSAQVIGTSYDKMRISLNKPIFESVGGKYINFYAMKQTGGISEFKVYGLHYKTEESGDAENSSGSGKKYMTITGMEDEFRWRMDTQTTAYKMPEAPTKILEVSVGTSGSAGIVLTEATSESTKLQWTTTDTTVKTWEYNDSGELEEVEKTFKKITGGNYFYDIYTGKIKIPRNNSEDIPWEKFEDNLKGTSILKSYLPDTLVMRYWSGNGRSLTFKARADGHGPSYMVEKNAIQKISSETLSSLPDNGTSGKVLTLDGAVTRGKSIPWFCYNNKPATLSIEQQSKSNSVQGTVSWNAGEFRKPVFTGKEIRDKLDDDQAFVNLFGPHCENCFGQCETEVTLTGAPNQIVSGHLTFIAEATTKRSIYVGGSTVTYEEKTGGLDNGILIVSCAPADAGDGRMTVCYDIPELLIYAKEPKLYT